MHLIGALFFYQNRHESVHGHRTRYVVKDTGTIPWEMMRYCTVLSYPETDNSGLYDRAQGHTA